MSQTDAESGTQLNRLRLRVFDLLEPAAPSDYWSKATDWFIVGLILGNAIAFALDTVPEIHAKYGYHLLVFSVLSGFLFTVEYCCRVWSSVEQLQGEDISYFRRRIRFMLRPIQLLDLVVVLSFWLVAFVPWDLTALRTIRILSFLRMARYSPAIASLTAAIKTEKHSLFSAFGLMLTAIFLSGVGFYYLERDIQPEAFGTLPAAMWHSSVVIFTVGFGDVVAQTAIGKFFSVVVMMFGIGIGALTISVVSAGFSQQSSQREFISVWSIVSKISLFVKMDVQALQTLTSLMETKEFKPGEVVFEKGQELDMLVVVLEEELLIEGDGAAGEFRQLLGRGSYFGDMALLEPRRTKVKVSADKDGAKLLVLTREKFQSLVNAQSGIRKSIERTVRTTEGGENDRLITEKSIKGDGR